MKRVREEATMAATMAARLGEDSQENKENLPASAAVNTPQAVSDREAESRRKMEYNHVRNLAEADSAYRKV